MEQGPHSSLFQVGDVTPMMDVPLPTSSCSLGLPFEVEPGLCALSPLQLTSCSYFPP